MLSEIRISDVNSYRTEMVRVLRTLRQEDPTFTVVDVGGTVGGWSAPVIDAIVDINPATPTSTIRFFSVNINDESQWSTVLDYVRENGKFSFAICSHTIEDVCNPGLVLRMLPEIAKEGTVSVPSKYHELSRIEGPYLGYIHHRWIYDIRANALVGYPKLGFLEYATRLHQMGRKDETSAQLSFRWKGSLPHSFVNNDYLGPNVQSVYTYYAALLD